MAPRSGELPNAPCEGKRMRTGDLTEDLREVLDGLELAWARADGKAFAAWFLPDATYVSRAGTLCEGREAIAKLHGDAFAGPQRGTTVHITIVRAQPLAEGIALVQATVRTTHDSVPGTIDALATVVMQRGDDGWRVAAAHTTQLE